MAGSAEDLMKDYFIDYLDAMYIKYRSNEAFNLAANCKITAVQIS